MSTVIVDYGSGNLRSAAKAFERMAAERGGGDVAVSSDPDMVARADRVVLPGVGAFRDCRDGLAAVDGMTAAVIGHIRAGKPFLGICVGMQLLATRGLEHSETPGFDVIAGDVARIQPSDPALKVPHMGWNAVTLRAPRHPLFAGLSDGDHAYFVHSYHLAAERAEDVAMTVDHGETLTAAVIRGNVAGTQFHPEKSQRAGLTLIGNFLNWSP